jgi:hypothetical protein
LSSEKKKAHAQYLKMTEGMRKKVKRFLRKEKRTMSLKSVDPVGKKEQGLNPIKRGVFSNGLNPKT